MPWVKKEQKRKWFKRVEDEFEEVQIVAKREWNHDYGDWTDNGTEYLVKNKEGKIFLVGEIYIN